MPRQAGRAVVNQRRLFCRAVAKRRRGAAVLVELAILLPLLVLLSGGIIDLSRFAHHYVAISDAAGAGVRFASFHPVTPTTTAYWNTATRKTVTDTLQEVSGFDPIHLTIEGPQVVQGVDGGPIRNVRLTVSYRFEPVIDWPGLPGEIWLRRRVEMKVAR